MKFNIPFKVPHSMRQRLSLSVFALFFVLAAISSYNSFEEVLFKNSEVHSLDERRIALLAQAARQLPKERSYVDRGVIVFDEPTPRLAAARFQTEISSIFASHGSIINSSQAGVAVESKNSELKLTINAEIVQSRLHELIYNIEIHRPFIFVRDISLKLKDEQILSTSDRIVTINIALSSSWKARRS